MALGAVLERFIEKSPVSVMARLAVQRAVSPEWVDSLFEEHQERQYTRELMFSSVVEMMSLVAMGLRPSLHAAANAQPKRLRKHPEGPRRRPRRATSRTALPRAMSPPRESWLQAMSDYTRGALHPATLGTAHPAWEAGSSTGAPSARVVLSPQQGFAVIAARESDGQLVPRRGRFASSAFSMAKPTSTRASTGCSIPS
jgi:hypothetical protein